MIDKALRWLSWLGLWLFMAGCTAGCTAGGVDATVSARCAPGATQRCACANGASGAQVCDDDGARWGDCTCVGGEDAGPQPTVDAGLGCGARARCGDQCVDTQNDPSHCGGCGLVCGAGQRCVGARCQVACAAGQTACGGGCVDLRRDGQHCGACEARCREGEQCAEGACRAANAAVTVRWEFPGLWERGRGETWLPTYATHLFGASPAVTHSFEMNLACAVIESREATPVRVDLTVRVPGFGADANRSVNVSPGPSTRVCINPGWDTARLAALRSFSNGTVETYARLADGRELSRAMRAFSALASNAVVWDELHDGLGRPLWWDEGGALATVFVTPNDPTVLNLRRGAELQSEFPGGFGADPYRRAGRRRDTTVVVGDHDWERLALEAGESMQWRLDSVSGGADADIDVYLFTEADYQAWRANTGTRATQVWRDRRSLDTGAFTAPQTSWYRLVLYNTRDNYVTRGISWTRSNTRSDVAIDALSAIFEELRGRGLTYVNISTAYFEGVQLIRRPRESLEMRAANCIDGALLFASVLENIGMEPWIVILPGHAFVAVSSGPGSTLAWGIETTLVGAPSTTAFGAVLRATDQLAETPRDRVTWVSVREARTRGLRPLPL